MARREAQVMLVHLGEQEFARLLAGKDDDMATGHLAICSECEQRLESWKGDLRQFRDDISFSSQRPNEYWHIQRNAIARKLEVLPSLNNFWNFGWTLACYALALSVLVLGFINFRETETTIKQPTEISDTQLLSDLEDGMTEEVPDALQPANLLVSEMSGTEDQGTKIIHNEAPGKSK
jgi:hypothetical protein